MACGPSVGTKCGLVIIRSAASPSNGDCIHSIIHIDVTALRSECLHCDCFFKTKCLFSMYYCDISFVVVSILKVNHLF